ncbi:hypothetical protein L3Q82_014660 [Scortum barcoo]|uniref:Uncharacterized protein n=1 Tax=Scortum barcoo TaxID=214431 RepID=A0ACB8VYR2_9TELE|nr:hypothetical protein L3Q82_014660 [Scortum barcoo]
MVIDFRRKKMPSQPLRIRGEVVDEVEDYKYLGVVIDNRLDWKSNHTEAVYKKGMSRLYFLRRLRSFNVGSRMSKRTTVISFGFCGTKIMILDKEIIDYWMTVHVFGNSPSPAVATYGLRKAAEHGEPEHGTDAKHFIFRNFYVDDGLASVAKER